MNGPEFWLETDYHGWWQQRNASLEAAREQVLLSRGMQGEVLHTVNAKS